MNADTRQRIVMAAMELFWEKGFPDVLNNALRTTMIKTLYSNWAEKAFQANTNPEKKQ